MTESQELIARKAEEAEELLLPLMTFRRSLENEQDWKRDLLVFVLKTKAEASKDTISDDLVALAENLRDVEERLPPESREPSFRCLASHKACMSEASSRTDKILCGLALAICLAKEVIPLA